MQPMQNDRAQSASLIILATSIDGVVSDIIIDGRHIQSIEPHDPARIIPDGCRSIDGYRTAAMPGLMNAHTHSAMTILRSYADDMPLMPWLEEKIWPVEAKLSEEDVYWGTRLACIEMIRSGTTFFSDMYWHFHGTARAARDSGMRAVVASALIDMHDSQKAKEQQAANLEYMDAIADYGPRLGFALGTHAIYTVSRNSLEWAARMQAERGAFVHIHLSETAGEVTECLSANGCRPPEYLDQIGLLNSRLFAAHCVHLDEADIGLMAERGAHPLHNPISNLKLASGGPMPYGAMRKAGIRPLIGTDGCASNNNLDLFEELKFAALLAKHATGDPTQMPAAEALELATRNPAQAFGLDCGRLEAGLLADIILIDLHHPMLFPGHDLAADLVYSATGRAVRTTICDGEVLMLDGVVADEAEIRAEVAGRLGRLIGSEAD